jgi:hypothetical protein
LSSESFQRSVDVLLVAAQWPERALLRAELIEAGCEVIAVDALQAAGSRVNPRVAVIDLRELPNPRVDLETARSIVAANCTIIITGLATLSVDELRQEGYEVIARPTSIKEIVTATLALLHRC